MQKPDPNKSRIQDIFASRFQTHRHMSELEALKLQGDLIFLPQDPIYLSTRLLDRLLVDFCKANRITEDYFSEKYRIYALNILGLHPTAASNNKSNLLKALKSGKITYKRFEEVICRVLGYSIKNVKFEFLQPEEKEVQKYELTDMEKDSKDDDNG